MSTLRVGDTGVQITVTVRKRRTPLDISAASVKEFIFGKPDGTTATVTAPFVNTGSDGLLKYVTLVGTLDQAGQWTLQARVVTPSYTLKSTKAHFTVEANIA